MIGSRSAIIASTGWPVRREWISPVASCFRIVTNCTGKGASRPSSARNRASSSRLKSVVSTSMAAGSPGASRMIRKVTSAMPSSTGTSWSDAPDQVATHPRAVTSRPESGPHPSDNRAASVLSRGSGPLGDEVASAAA